MKNRYLLDEFPQSARLKILKKLFINSWRNYDRPI
ncbi:hypothetical protein BN439_0680 [Erwinia amylovora Ea644]|nr:hypothetical protein BN439_0680 [Erwinia amylovora Ea644]CCP05778.1 hypothetical protein BN440_0727 [Erwinia amylovora MR1]